MSTTNPNQHYDAIALKIVPTGSKPTVGQIRKGIAEWLAWEVGQATTKQREQHFPELAEVRKELDVKKKDLDKQLAALQERERALQAREQKQTQNEAKLATLVKAFEGWLGWMDGDGEVDENAQRFHAVREAYRAYKGGKR